MNGSCSTHGRNEIYRPIQNLVETFSKVTPTGGLILKDNIRNNPKEIGYKWTVLNWFHFGLTVEVL
jgi:hypothetical protein